MNWRKYPNHREETKAVKQALADVAIQAKVGHGTGTAWSWLEIHVLTRLAHVHDRERYGWAHCSGNCEACRDFDELRSRTLAIAQSVTGRTGDYHGNILVQIG